MKKKTFARFLTLALCLTSLAYSAAAFEPETPETAAEIAVTDDELALAEDVQYAARPAENDETLGKLIYFNNGETVVNDSNIVVKGLAADTETVDGYYVHSINTMDTVFNGGTYGSYIVPNGEAFTDAEGNALNGTLTVCVEMFNALPAETSPNYRGFFESVLPNPNIAGWQPWQNVYTKYDSQNAYVQQWNTLKFSYDASATLIGFGKAGSTDPDKMYVRSVYVYYVADAEKPAETDAELGELIYFNNGKEEITTSNITVKGLVTASAVVDGYYTHSINPSDTVFNGSDTYPYVVVVPKSGSTVFTDAQGKELNGTLTVCIELYNSFPKDDSVAPYRGFLPMINPDPCRETFVQWSAAGNAYVSWDYQQNAKNSEWNTLKLSQNTTASLLGFIKAGKADPDKMHVRSVYVYYKPALTEAIIKTADSYSVRTADPSGIRFGGFIEAKTMLASDECGFIIARGDQIAANNYDADTEVRISGEVTDSTSSSGNFTALTQNGLKLVGVRNYVKDATINKLVAADEGKTPFGDYEKDGFYFTGVVTNLDGSYTNAQDGIKYAHRYNAPLVARTYVKVGSSYFYGECRETSLYDVVSNLVENDSDTCEQNKEYFDKICNEADNKA